MILNPVSEVVWGNQSQLRCWSRLGTNLKGQNLKLAWSRNKMQALKRLHVCILPFVTRVSGGTGVVGLPASLDRCFSKAGYFGTSVGISS